MSSIPRMLYAYSITSRGRWRSSPRTSRSVNVGVAVRVRVSRRHLCCVYTACMFQQPTMPGRVPTSFCSTYTPDGQGSWSCGVPGGASSDGTAVSPDRDRSDGDLWNCDRGTWGRAANPVCLVFGVGPQRLLIRVFCQVVRHFSPTPSSLPTRRCSSRYRASSALRATRYLDTCNSLASGPSQSDVG